MFDVDVSKSMFDVDFLKTLNVYMLVTLITVLMFVLRPTHRPLQSVLASTCVVGASTVTR